MILFLEEVLQSPEALWSSYDGTHLLYATFNDSEVGILKFPWFQTGSVLGTTIKGASSSPRDSSFPDSKSVRYPTVRKKHYVFLLKNLKNISK